MAAMAAAEALWPTTPPERRLGDRSRLWVGYTRVHTGVHYAGDAVTGAAIGATVGELVGWGLARPHRPGSGSR
jgi:hypothetical protein